MKIQQQQQKYSVHDNDLLFIDLPINHYQTSASFVMILNRQAPIKTKRWLISLLQENHLNLSIIDLDNQHRQSSSSSSLPEDLILLISCSEKLLEENANHVYKQLKRQHLKQPDDLNKLNTAEKQRILYDWIRRICSTNRTSIVGLPDVTLYPGQSIIEICCYQKVITHYFPLHDYEHLENLRSNYCVSFSHNIDYVRNYFGEMIGFYFAFLNYYRDMFCLATIVYLISCLLHIPNELYTIIICFGSFVFIKMWKRFAKRLAFDWGTIDLIELEKARPAFRSKGMRMDTTTEEMVPYYPITKTWCKEYFISVPFVIVCLYLSFELMCIYFDCEDWMASHYNEDPSILNFIFCFVPSIVYAVIVMFMNHLYIVAATRLNNYENHKTQESHENHLIVKLVLFEFFNNFICLFYIAFYMKDMDMLRYTLITMLTVNKTVENFLEVFIPMFLIYRNDPKKLFGQSSNKSQWQQQIYDEKNLYIYEHTYYDCLELFIQYGYAFLFISIWPWAPLVAAINSVMEVRMDAAKLVYCKRRPFQKSMKSINNAWIKSFEVLSIIIVISNFLTLELVSDQVQLLGFYFNLSTFKLVVYAEHIFLTIVLIFWYVVPDIPRDVHHRLNRRKYLQLTTASTTTTIASQDKKLD
ncbi:Anoctamin-10 [Dermatophagoides farinae]|uniref:Anoctamin n=1 Tax=Dermatophagoides farinae TaxID=6954 RepID=A0A922KYW0_DERFA|nr:Anoctamin-10 [Dermatophagoides farinae]